MWLRGGYPQSYLAASDADSMALRRDFIRSYLEREVAVFGPRIPAATLERLWTMLAHLQGTMLNASTLARSLEVSVQSVTRYIDLLVDLLVVRRLAPLHSNVAKRLVKTPKVYVRDSGLVHALLGVTSANSSAGHPVVGTSWEGWVIETLLTALPPRSRPAFYRTSASAEIDLVIEHDDGTRWAVEIQRSLSARVSRGFHVACGDIKPERALIVHAGDDHYPVAPTIEAISVRQLAADLAARLPRKLLVRETALSMIMHP